MPRRGQNPVALPHVRKRREQRHMALVGLGYDSYNEYLRSSHWAGLKVRFRASDQLQACVCGEEEGLQLHHKTYERVGNELLDDLVLLCRGCHEAVHTLERQGVMSLDTRELSSEERAVVYAVEQAERKHQAANDFENGHTDDRPLDVQIREVLELAEKHGVDTVHFHMIVRRRVKALRRTISQRSGA